MRRSGCLSISQHCGPKLRVRQSPVAEVSRERCEDGIYTDLCPDIAVGGCQDAYAWIVVGRVVVNVLDLPGVSSSRIVFNEQPQKLPFDLVRAEDPAIACGFDFPCSVPTKHHYVARVTQISLLRICHTPI